MFNGDPNWMGGYFFMGLFAGAPVGNHVISGGELYYNRTVTQFSNWKTTLSRYRNFGNNALGQPHTH